MNVFIIEDEIAALQRLHKLLGQIRPAIEVVGTADSIESAVQLINRGPEPDLMFMDIHLADGSSFEIFKLVRVQKPIVFTTAYDQYALQAFSVHAVDYLLKPIKPEELQRAVEKYRRIQHPSELDYEKLAKMVSDRVERKRFLIRIGQRIKVVDLQEVAYFYTQDKITFLVTYHGKRYPIDYSLEKLEIITEPHRFFRINRQFIIHIEAIDSMYAYSKSRVKIDLQPPCDVETVVSTERSPHFKKWLVGED